MHRGVQRALIALAAGVVSRIRFAVVTYATTGERASSVMSPPRSAVLTLQRRKPLKGRQDDHSKTNIWICAPIALSRAATKRPMAPVRASAPVVQSATNRRGRTERRKGVAPRSSERPKSRRSSEVGTMDGCSKGRRLAGCSVSNDHGAGRFCSARVRPLADACGSPERSAKKHGANR